MQRLKDELNQGGIRIIPFEQKIINRENPDNIYRELLVRFGNPDGGLENIFPYLKRIEEQKEEYEFDLLFLNEALRAVSRKQEETGEEFDFSINIFPRTFLHPNLPPTVCELLHKYKIKTHLLTFELLERGNSLSEVLCLGRTCCGGTPIEGGCSIIKKCSSLQKDIITRVGNILVEDVGIKLAIDDFPAGNNNYQILDSLAGLYSAVKIDGEFIETLYKSCSEEQFVEKMNKIVKMVLAKNPKLHIVAEKVSSEELKIALDKVEGITHYQGFIFHKPEQL